MKPSRFGRWAWCILATYIVTVDAVALRTGRPTLSEAFGRAMAHPRGRWCVIAAGSVVARHLYLPMVAPWSDPLGLLGRVVRPREGR